VTSTSATADDTQRDAVSLPARRWIIVVLLVAAASVCLTTFLQLQNPRVLVSWHGFLHTAIANRFPGSFQRPENPFFAGERLPYYWVHQAVATAVGRALGVHVLYAFQLITATGLILLWTATGAVGVHRLGSLKAGLLAGFLALAGVNPLGPAIAATRHILQNKELFTAPQPADTIFVADHQSEELMTQPLLPALYVSADWRRGENIAWYLDNSSRGIALALLFWLVFVFTGGTPSMRALTEAGLIAAGMTALNPLVGLAAAGSLLAGSVAAGLMSRLTTGSIAAASTAMIAVACAAVAGAAIASPTYYHLFLVGGSGMTVFASRETLLRAAALALNVVVLLPMAAGGALVTTGPLRDRCRALLIAACGLLCVVPFISLTDDTEHNLANTAQALLVVPAVALVVTKRVRWLTAGLVVSICAPMAVATLAAYVGRPPLPVAFDGPVMHRTSDDPLDGLYRWIRDSTPHNAVFVANPLVPAKMSGNVAELPAFTGRTLFVDHASYLTTPHRDFERRSRAATRLVDGLPTSPDAADLAALRRPVYLLSYRGDQREFMDRLGHLYGAPVFHDRFVAVFDLNHSVSAIRLPQ
jgi:hypothetical protein